MADFSLPTIRVSEFAHTDEEEGKIEDPMKTLLTGGQPRQENGGELSGRQADQGG